MMGSARDLNSLCLVGKPMLLLNTLLSFAIIAVAVAILMRISALHVPSFGQDCSLVEVWHYFQQLTIHGNVGTDVVSVVLHDFRPFYVYSHAVCAGTCNRWVCQVLQFVVAAPIRYMSRAKRRLQTSQSPIKMAVCCSLRVSCMTFLGQQLNRTREIKHPYLTPTECPEEFF